MTRRLSRGVLLAAAVLALATACGSKSTPPATTTTAAAAPAHWAIADLGTLGPTYKTSIASAIDEQGDVVGGSGTANSTEHAFLWRDGKMTDLGTLGGRDSGAAAINEHGQVIGQSLTAKPARTHGFVWQDGEIADLGTLGGPTRPAPCDQRQGPDRGGERPGERRDAAVLWQNGKMTDLGTLGGPLGYALAINASGQVVGESKTAAGKFHAFLWQNGKLTDLGTLGPLYTDAAPSRYDTGQVAERATPASSPRTASKAMRSSGRTAR